MASIDCTKTTAKWDDNHWNFGLGAPYMRHFVVHAFWLIGDLRFKDNSLPSNGLCESILPYIRACDTLHKGYIDGLVQDCSNSIANALELLQSCTKPSIWSHDPNLVKLEIYVNIKNNGQIMSQFYMCHDSCTVITCAQLWYDWIS